MAGCPNPNCDTWKSATHRQIKTIEVADTIVARKAWFIKHFSVAIKFCPWCGSKLTPPKEEE